MPKKRRLKTGTDIRRYLAYLIHRTEDGAVDPGVAGKLGYLCNLLLKAIEVGEFEERLARLEQMQGVKK